MLHTYKVEVVGETEYGKGGPKVIEVEPRNISVSRNSNLIIKCEVESEVHPNIMWLKETDEKTNDTVEYFHKYYKRIPTSVNNMIAIPSRMNVFLSKLSIQDVSSYGSGLYVCLAMSVSGIDFKTVSINIEGGLSSAVSVQATNNPSALASFPYLSHFFLFLVPFSLILVPVIFWLCYYRKKMKRKSKRPVPVHDSAALMKPIITINNHHVDC